MGGRRGDEPGAEVDARSGVQLGARFGAHGRAHAGARRGAPIGARFGAQVGVAARVLVAVVGRPRLWPVAVREARRLAPTDWWRRPPFLPVPPPAYRRFRLQTMYGVDDQIPAPDDLVRWLEWCRSH